MITLLKGFAYRNWPILAMVFIMAICGGAATIVSLPQLPTPSGGIFTQDNLNQINTNATSSNTNFSNINAVIGAAGASPSGSGNLCLTTSCVMTTPNVGTPSAIVLTNATGTPAGAGVMLDTGSIAIPLASLQTLNSVPLQIIAAPGATSMIQVGSCTLNLTRGAAAFTGGGTVSIGYDTTSSPATNGTIASTVFTTFASSHAVVVLPVAVAVTATTSLANKGIFMSAASADFAVGTGASGQIDCNYRIVTGVS